MKRVEVGRIALSSVKFLGTAKEGTESASEHCGFRRELQIESWQLRRIPRTFFNRSENLLEFPRVSLYAP